MFDMAFIGNMNNHLSRLAGGCPIYLPQPVSGGHALSDKGDVLMHEVHNPLVIFRILLHSPLDCSTLNVSRLNSTVSTLLSSIRAENTSVSGLR